MKQLLEGRPRRIGVWLEGEPIETLELDDPALIEGEGQLESIVLDGEPIDAAMALRIHGVMRESLELWATLVVDGVLRSGRLESAECVAVGLRVDVFERAKASVPVAAAAPTDGWAQAAALSAAAQSAPVAPAPAPVSDPIADLERRKERVRKKKKQMKSSVPLPEKKPIPKASDRRSSFVDQPLPEVGDYVDHKQFGICEVKSIDDEGALVIRTKQGRRRRLVLDVFDVHEPRIDDDKIIYPLRPRKR